MNQLKDYVCRHHQNVTGKKAELALRAKGVSKLVKADVLDSNCECEEKPWPRCLALYVKGDRKCWFCRVWLHSWVSHNCISFLTYVQINHSLIYHFLLECSLYTNLRCQCIPRYFRFRPSMQKLIELVTNENPVIIKTLMHICM